MIRWSFWKMLQDGHQSDRPLCLSKVTVAPKDYICSYCKCVAAVDQNCLFDHMVRVTHFWFIYFFPSQVAQIEIVTWACKQEKSALVQMLSGWNQANNSAAKASGASGSLRVQMAAADALTLLRTRFLLLRLKTQIVSLCSASSLI